MHGIMFVVPVRWCYAGGCGRRADTGVPVRRIPTYVRPADFGADAPMADLTAQALIFYGQPQRMRNKKSARFQEQEKEW